MPDHAEDFQAEVLFAYTILSALRPDWPGSLILSCGLGPQGSAVALAAHIAGAAILAIDERPDICRAAMRSGACDFAVNSVDEALRALKNEIRQRRPLGVALELSPNLALTELLDRGVVPQLFTTLASEPNALDPAIRDRAVNTLRPLGTQFVGFFSVKTIPAESLPTSPARSENHLQMHTFRFSTAAELHAFDVIALAELPWQPDRRNWLLSAGRLFPRDRHRVLWLKEHEYRQLTSSK